MYKIKSNIINVTLDTKIGYNLLKKRFDNTVIMYHGVSEKSSPYNKRHTIKKDFIKHLLFLKKHCNIISLNQFFNKEFKKDKINVALTFDDGYWNNFSIAKPILEEMKVPATFFITGINNTIENFLWADFVDILAKSELKKNIYLDELNFELRNNSYCLKNSEQALHQIIKHEKAEYETKISLYNNLSHQEKSIILNEENKEFWKLMDDSEIIETAKSKYIDIQSHGFYHNNLGTIDLELALNEGIESKKYLENLTQKTIDTIGFPDGSYTKDFLDEIEKFGISKFTAAEGFLFDFENNDNRIIDRKGMYDVGKSNNQLYNSLVKS
ncbi:MAG: polysaccharide deacetylase family protein [Bacteroidia bacterium]|nr:polysaccharide deacetylase family protein [Bacteroidia bacterium]